MMFRPSPMLASFTLENADPAWFWIALVLASLLILLLGYRQVYRRTGRRTTWTFLLLRFVGVLALLTALVKPSWTSMHEQVDRPHLAVIIDDSQSMSLPASAADGTRLSRYERATKWLELSDAGRSLQNRFEVSLFDLAGQQMAPNDLNRTPAAEQTDLVRALRNVSARMRGRHTAGIVLISDGRETTGRQSLIDLEQFALPVYGLGYKSTSAAHADGFDLSVAHVEAPARAMVHNAVPIQVLIRKDGGPAIEAPLQVELAGRLLHSERVELPQGAGDTRTTITFTPDQPGDFVFTLHLPMQPSETTDSNNRQFFKLRVEAEPIRVLYIEGVLRPEATYLRERLGQDPDIDLVSFMRSAHPDQADLRDTGLWAELTSPERIEKIDVILLGDFESTMLDEQAYSAIRARVEAGGGLMVLGGYSNLSQQGLWNTPLGELLPALPSSSVLPQLDEPFNFKLTPEGSLHPAMFLTGDTVRDAAAWQDLPALLGIALVGPARPGASVLARHPRVIGTGSHDLGSIVLATQSFGQGSVVLMTADSTWRWSRIARLAGRPDTLYLRFWAQMIRWLARRDIHDQQTALTVSTDHASYERGQRVQINVRRNPMVVIPGDDTGGGVLEVQVRTPDRRTIELPATKSLADAIEWNSNYYPDRGGRFEVLARLVSPAENQASRELANQATEFLVQGSDLELSDPASNPATLVQVARLTGGLYADIDDRPAAEEMVASLPAQPRVSYRAQVSRLWNSPVLFVLFLVLITLEWVLRRRNQLV